MDRTKLEPATLSIILMLPWLPAFPPWVPPLGPPPVSPPPLRLLGAPPLPRALRGSPLLGGLWGGDFCIK